MPLPLVLGTGAGAAAGLTGAAVGTAGTGVLAGITGALGAAGGLAEAIGGLFGGAKQPRTKHVMMALNAASMDRGLDREEIARQYDAWIELERERLGLTMESERADRQEAISALKASQTVLPKFKKAAPTMGVLTLVAIAAGAYFLLRQRG